MSPLAFFLIFKVGLALALIAFAAREIRIARRPDADPAYTQKLVHAFSASRRACHPRAPAPDAPPLPAAAPEPEEAPRRAA